MASSTQIRTPYERRIELVKKAISSHSQLGDKAAGALAVDVLHALDTIPEKMR